MGEKKTHESEVLREKIGKGDSFLNRSEQSGCFPASLPLTALHRVHCGHIVSTLTTTFESGCLRQFKGACCKSPAFYFSFIDCYAIIWMDREGKMRDSTESFCTFIIFVNQALKNGGIHLFLSWPNFILEFYVFLVFICGMEKKSEKQSGLLFWDTSLKILLRRGALC